MCVSINDTFFSGEHLWPRSYGLIDHPSLTDLHNIRPADVNGKMGFSRCHWKVDLIKLDL